MELNDFLARLDATLHSEGMSYGPGVWLRVHQLINRLNYHRSPPKDFHQLMLQLRPLFCRNPEEQKRFTFLFEQSLVDTPHSLASVNQIASPYQRAIDKSLEKADKINRYWWWGGAVLLFALVAIIAWSWSSSQKTQEPSKPPIIQPEPVKTGEPPTKSDLPPEPIKSAPIVNFVAPQLQPEPEPDPSESLPWFLLLLPWLGVAWWLGKTYAQKLALAREPRSGDSLLNQLPFEQPFTPIWGGVDAEQSLRELRAARLISTRRLDVKATVEATARNGDYFQPVYRTRRIAPEHVLLVRSLNPNDQQAELAQELAARIKSLGMQVSVYRFRDDPRWLARYEGKGVDDYFQLDQIIVRHGNARLLVISETDILFHPYSGKPRAWLAALSPWQDKAWLHPYDARKPHAELLTEHDFLVLPLSRDSLPELVGRLTAVEPSRLIVPATRTIELPDILVQEPDGWLDEQPPYGVGLADLEWELEHYLGTYGLRLLRAIAVYPKPHWKLTLALDYLLFGRLGKAGPTDPPAQREQRLSRLSRLPWLKHGFMPNWLREQLLVNSDADERQHVVNVWQSLFSQLSQKGGEQSLQLEFSTPSKRQIKLYWNKLRMMPQSDAINDPIFAHILMGGKFGWLDFHLPRKLSKRLPFAQRVMNLRPVFGAVAGAMLGMAAVFGMIKMLVEPPLDPAQWQITLQYQSDTKALADLLQQRLLEDQFRVMQPAEISDSALITNAIIYPVGGESAATRIKQRLRWLAYGADVVLHESPALDAHTIQVQWANPYGAAFNDTLHIQLETRLPFEPEMVRIPAGTFLMGSPETEAERLSGEGPQREVTIAPFEIGKYEVTFDEYDAFAKATNRILPSDNGWGRGRQPVIKVSWHDAQAYVKWLSGKTGKQYRLPTEAEWEYVARAKSQTRYWWGDDIGENNAVCGGCGSEWDKRQTAPVGSFLPNPFRLHDTAGNVWEWTQDCWHGTYDNAPVDGSAWLEAGGGDCNRRVVRGGSWLNLPHILRSADRGKIATTAGTNDLGFRIARDF